MTLLILYFSLAILASFLCSILEAVILSISPAYVAVSAQKGRKSGILLAELKSNIDRPLAAILTLNTIAHTFGAAGVGAQVDRVFGSTYLSIASVILTFCVLVFSEIIPKTIGASNWKRLAPFSAFSIYYLIKVLYPFVLLSEAISKMLKSGEHKKVTREEMIVTAELGATEGTLRKKESLIIKNLLLLSNVYVYDIMTPRSVMMTLDANLTVGEVMEQFKPIRYSRIPVYQEGLDNIIGVIHRYKILEAASHDQSDKKLKDLMTPIHSIPEDLPVSACLDQLIQRQDHIFLVVDEYGMTMGIVTLEDSIETLLGVEIVDEFDSVADLRQFALEQWNIRKSKKKKDLEAVQDPEEQK